MESLKMLRYIMFPSPPNLFISSMSVVSFVSLANAGFSEIRGKNMKYSKFWVSSGNSDRKLSTSGRNGMLIAYTPAFLAGVASFVLLPHEDLRALLVNAALTIHFFKRIFEVLFIHKYSGGIDVDTAIPISASYFTSTATMIYTQHLTQGYAQPSIDLSYPGIVLFLIGITGNFYHHYLLSNHRSKNEKEYKIPKGGLFNVVICPHYLFEVLGYWGISFISQTLFAYSFSLGTTIYLLGRSYATRRWYVSKFDDFPRHVKAFLPFVF